MIHSTVGEMSRHFGNALNKESQGMKRMEARETVPRVLGTTKSLGVNPAQLAITRGVMPKDKVEYRPGALELGLGQFYTTARVLSNTGFELRSIVGLRPRECINVGTKPVEAWIRLKSRAVNQSSCEYAGSRTTALPGRVYLSLL